MEMNRKRKVSDDVKITNKRVKGNESSDQMAEPSNGAHLPSKSSDTFVPAAMDVNRGMRASRSPSPFPRQSQVPENDLVPQKQMLANGVVFISPEKSISRMATQQIMTWKFKEGTVRTPATVVDHHRVLRNPTFGRRVDYGGVYDSNHHGRENLSPGFSNVSDAYIRLLEKQSNNTSEIVSNPYAAWRVKGKSVDEIKGMIRWDNIIARDANTWIAGNRNAELRRQQSNRLVEYQAKAVWRSPNPSAIRPLPTEWPVELSKIVQAQNEIFSENEAASNMDDDQDMDDLEDVPPEVSNVFNRSPNADNPLPSTENLLDENMTDLQSSDFQDIAGYSDSETTSDSDTDSDSDPEDLYSDDSSVSSNSNQSNRRAARSSPGELPRYLPRASPRHPFRTFKRSVPTITDPYRRGVATNAQEDHAVRETIYRPQCTYAARKHVAAGPPAINSGQYCLQRCSWRIIPSSHPWSPARQAKLIIRIARLPVPVIRLTIPEGVYCGLQEALEDLSQDWEYRRSTRDQAQPSLSQKLRTWRSWHESRRERMLRQEKDEFWEECRVKDAEIDRVEMEQLGMLMGIRE